jgi:hypothetical protein
VTTKSKSGHSTCCKHIKRPKTANALAELLYPPEESHYPHPPRQGYTWLNRIQNPDAKRWRFRAIATKYDKTTKKHVEVHVPVSAEESGWWFPLRAGYPLLDGTGEGESRGDVGGHPGIAPIKLGSTSYSAVCINACSLKSLPYRGKERVCGFTWYVRTSLEVEVKATATTKARAEKFAGAGSGWIPLDALRLGKSDREKIDATLRDLHCCAGRYGAWGALLADRQPTEYRFRSESEVSKALAGMNAHNISAYFDDKHHKIEAIIARVAKASSPSEALYPELYFSHNPSAGHFGDYLPRTPDHKGGKYPGNRGYTYVNANLSKPGKGRAGSAPIAIDVFPAGWSFHRLTLKKVGHVLAPIFAAPKTQGGHGVQIGYAVWYFGYAVKKGGKPADRSYGWVPALALEGPKAKSKAKKTTHPRAPKPKH